MIYRYDKAANPRLLVMKLVLAVVAAAAFLAVFTVPAIISLPLFIVAAILVFKVYGVYHNLVESFINVHDDGVSGKTPGGRTVQMQYRSVTDAGLATDISGARILYLYNENDDQLIQIPDLYRNFDELVQEISSNQPVRSLTLKEGQTLEELLKDGSPEQTSGQ
ncbi:hypothetical protein [Spirochaeta africana]|uniref:Uncharacterized protein n=1 Tax=Spirochaeta africana (strain ATCC 700263 / DSM 8902 / Z-7692) TaxID=889378 RepID=H9ULW6_SPIAZ|nr:hypothetical protein [Spirochaeta africana]AFG38509.1 hypothetical protein Spiaf_2478 [Spirochaeta africana DSM 8902]